MFCRYILFWASLRSSVRLSLSWGNNHPTVYIIYSLGTSINVKVELEQAEHRGYLETKDWSEMKMTNVFSKISLVKSSKKFFIFLSVFYLTICLMKALKSFGKRGILKTWELVSLGGAKIHFGKIAMK